LRWNLGDFILWHGCKKGDEYCWETEIGKGRPAWNIQDASAIMNELGSEIDIICGGVDNLYRHHDYTIAIIESISGNQLARFWLHGEHLLVDGKKMSKSKGNVILLDSLIEDGYNTSQIRFFLIYGHYRKKLNYNQRNIDQACKKLDDVRSIVRKLLEKNTDPLNVDLSIDRKEKQIDEVIKSLTFEFQKNMNNDLDVCEAFNSLSRNLEKLNSIMKDVGLSRRELSEAIQQLKKIDNVLKVIF
jgi:cysteinyl-tRNA synthetase